MDAVSIEKILLEELLEEDTIKSVIDSWVLDFMDCSTSMEVYYDPSFTCVLWYGGTRLPCRVEN